MLHEEKSIVLYCDASTRPNPGKIGIGIHGYIYNNTEIKKPLLVNNICITNKGYKQKDSLNGSYFVTPEKYIDFVQAVLDEGSNNQGEIIGLNKSLNMVNYDDKIFKNITIYTDSEYVRKGINEWCAIWEKNNWKRNDGVFVSNLLDWKNVYERYNYLKSLGCIIDIQWIRSHNDDIGNTKADALSVIGMNRATLTNQSWSEQTISEAKNYWKVDIDKHPFVNFKRVYFNSIKNFNINGQYFQSEPGVTELTVGKRSPEAGFSIVRLNEPDYVIEMIRNKQCYIANETNAIIMLKLDRVYNSNIYKYLRDYGEYSLLTNKQNLNLNFIDNKPITMELNPTNLSMRAIEAFNYLEELLEQFIHKESDVLNIDIKTNNSLMIHDITDNFFDSEIKKNKTKLVLKEKINDGDKNLKIFIDEEYNGKNIKILIPYLLGIDILPRNNLKKLETSNPKISLITWRESVNTLRYATIIKCDTGIGIWSNFFADKIFLSTFNNVSTD